MDYRLYFAILAGMFVPVIYRTVRFYWLGTLPDPYSFSIAGNLEWINVLFEVLNEAFVLPIYFVFSRNLHKESADKAASNAWVAGKFYIILGLYVVFAAIFIGVTRQLMLAISSTPPNAENMAYVRLQFGNQFFAILGVMSTALLTLKGKWVLMMLVLTFQTVLGAVLDIFLVSNLSVSAQLGVLGVGWSDLINYFTTGVLAFTLVMRVLGMRRLHWLKPVWNYYVGFFQAFVSGLESLIRNAFFIIFVIATVNRLGGGFSQGDYWLTNSVIWDWMLMPVLAAGVYTNRSVAIRKNEKLWSVTGGPFIIVATTVILWFVFIPAYEPFARYVLNTTHYELIGHLQLISLGFYAMFAFNEVVDKIFYGKGKPTYILAQSIFTNVVVYIPYYFLAGILTIDDVAVMFGVSLAVDSTLTFGMFFVWKFGYAQRFKKHLLNYKIVARFATACASSRIGVLFARMAGEPRPELEVIEAKSTTYSAAEKV